MLLRNAFTKALWDARRSLPGWTLAIIAVGAMYAGTWPSVNNPEMLKAMESYPEALKQAFNFDDFTTAAGYLGSSVYGLIVALLVAVFAIAWGTRSVAGDEDAGTLDLVLAHPVSRTRLALQRATAMATALLVVALALLLVMIALRGPAQFDDITVGAFAATNLQLALLGLCFGSLAFAVGAATGRRGLTLGITAGAAVLAYLANTLIPRVDGLAWVRNLSPFHWYLGGKPLLNGLQVADSLLLLGVSVLLVALGTLAFNRRDVAV